MLKYLQLSQTIFSSKSSYVKRRPHKLLKSNKASPISALKNHSLLSYSPYQYRDKLCSKTDPVVEKLLFIKHYQANVSFAWHLSNSYLSFSLIFHHYFGWSSITFHSSNSWICTYKNGRLWQEKCRADGTIREYDFISCNFSHASQQSTLSYYMI